MKKQVVSSALVVLALCAVTVLQVRAEPEESGELAQYWTRARAMLNSDTVKAYQQRIGIESLPSLDTVMRVPEKLLRAELAMLDEEIRMAQNMMQNPIAATINAPTDLATMLARMTRELES